MRIQTLNILIASVLQEFQQQYTRFRCSVGRKQRRVQTCPGGISGKGLTERQCKTPHASEPEPKPQKPPQPTEHLTLTGIRQETLRVQMHRKTTASELRKNADSSAQYAHSKRIARISTAIPEVQMLSGNETQHSRMQTRPAGTSGKGLTERHHKPPHASEPEPKP